MKSQLAHKSVGWLKKPSPLRPSQTLQSGGQNQRVSTNGQGGYITLAAWGILKASERGTKSQDWARWQHSLCRLGGRQNLKSEDKLKSGAQVERVVTQRPSPRGVRGHGGYITPAAWEVRTGSKWRTKSEPSNNCSGRLHNPCRLHSRRQNRKWPKTSPSGYSTRAAGGARNTSKRGTNWKWPTSGPGGCISLAAQGPPNTSQWQTESTLAHKLAVWLYKLDHLRGSPTLQSGEQNHSMSTNGQRGYITPSMWRVLKASQRTTKSQDWARWLHSLCHL